MRINITARRFKLSESLKSHAEDEVRRLKKYYDGIIDTEIILGWEKKNRIAEISILVYGTKLTAHERSEDMVKSINLAVDKLERQLIKYKDRRKSFEHETIGKNPVIMEGEDIPEIEGEND